MGKIDVLTKNYLKNNVVFSDAVNYLLHDGKKVIKPETLRELDSVHDAMADHGRVVQRTQDVFKGCLGKQDDDNIYLLISLENQTLTDLTMPVRTMLGDAITYMDQIHCLRDAHEENRKSGGFQWRDPTERLSGITYSDRLKPVITLVIHWNGTPWNGPHSLHELLDFEEEWIRRWVPDWPLFLIDAAEIGEEERQKFSSDLGNVLHLIQCSADKKKLTALRDEPPLLQLGSAGRRVVRELTGIRIKEKEEKEVTDAVKEWIEEIREEGRNEGLSQGLSQGINEGRSDMLKTLYTGSGYTPDEFMDTLKIPDDEREAYRKMLE